MGKNLTTYVRESGPDEEPFVLPYEKSDGETGRIKFVNPNRLKGRAFLEFAQNQSDYAGMFRSLVGDQFDELFDAFDRIGIDGEGQKDLMQDAMKHYGFVQGEASASST